MTLDKAGSNIEIFAERDDNTIEPAESTIFSHSKNRSTSYTIAKFDKLKH